MESTVTEPQLIPHQEGDPLCDWCDALVPISRAEARLIRLLFGPVWCKNCSPPNNYEIALNELRSDIRASHGDDVHGPSDDTDEREGGV